MKGGLLINVVKSPDFVGERSDESNEDSEPVIDRESQVTNRAGLGDRVESWAKPIGCWLDRQTARFPFWLVKARLNPNRIELVPRAAVRRKLSYRVTHHKWRLPSSLRTAFCSGTCGCSKRKRFLNFVIPDVRSASAWFALCRHPATAIYSAFQTVYPRPQKG